MYKSQRAQFQALHKWQVETKFQHFKDKGHRTWHINKRVKQNVAKQNVKIEKFLPVSIFSDVPGSLTSKLKVRHLGFFKKSRDSSKRRYEQCAV